MLRTIPSALLCWLFLLAQSHGQDVFVPRELKALAVTRSEKEPAKTAPANEPSNNLHPEKVESAKAGPAKAPTVKEAGSKK